MARKRMRPEESPRARRSTKASQEALELEQFTDAAVTFINESLKRSDVQHDAIANFLYSSVCASGGLDPSAYDTSKLRALQSEAGGRLRLDRTALSRHLRVGIVNALVKDKRWHALAWSHKVALLPLVKNDASSLDTLSRALDANKQPTVLALNAWVQQANREAAVSTPRKTVTVASARRFFSTALRLADPEVLMSLTKRVGKLDEESRREIRKALDVMTVVAPQMSIILGQKD